MVGSGSANLIRTLRTHYGQILLLLLKIDTVKQGKHVIWIQLQLALRAGSGQSQPFLAVFGTHFTYQILICSSLL